MHKLPLLLVAVLLVLAGCASQKATSAPPLPIFDLQWDYQHPDSTETHFTAILRQAENRHLATYNPSYHAQLLTQIARAQGLQGKFAEAQTSLDAAAKIITDEMPSAHIRYLLEQGRIDNASGKKEEAKALFMDAWEFGRDKNLELYALDAVHMLGIVDVPEKQLEWNLKALQIAEDSWDKRCKAWLGALYNNIGWSYYDMENYQTALEYFEKGLAWRQKKNDAYGTRIAKWAVARTHRSLGHTDIALKMQLELLDEISRLNLPPDGYVHEELGELYLLKGDADAAKQQFAAAWKILSADSWLQQNEPARLQRLKELSN